jgi:hypothetical protein
MRGKLTSALPLGASMLALLLAPVASASTLNDVVHEPGTIAGQPYRYWMTRTWELYFSSLAPGAQACKTVTVNGTAVTLVGNFSGRRSTCNVPAGSAVYVNEYTTHCSTLPDEHEGFGTSDAELQKCSLGVNRSTVKALINVWLDGRSVPKFGKYFWMGTQAFPVNVKEQEVEAAAWGWSLLMRPLPKGTHTVRCEVLDPNRKPKTESIVTLHVA